MEADKLEKVKGIIGQIISWGFNFIVSIVNILITFVILFGALASTVLLYKMFPDTALIYLKPMILILSLFMKIFYVSLFILATLGACYLVFEVMGCFKRMDKKRDIERKKFLDDVVKKITREMKNK